MRYVSHFDLPVDWSIRKAAFDWLGLQTELHGDTLPRSLLQVGFQFGSAQIRLVGPQGIFKPQAMALPLSITTAPNSPYADSIGVDGLLRYKYRGSDPAHHENEGLRELFRRQIPLVYLHGLMPGTYVAMWPVFITHDDPRSLTFTAAVDDPVALSQVRVDGHLLSADDAAAAPRRQYVTVVARRRLHQQLFRERVLHAYKSRCALCRLKHAELLDAAHITPDADEDGEPITSNGLSLCKLHHTAFDRHFLTVSPDYRVMIRRDLMDETDGPMLKHGLQGLDGQPIVLPGRESLRPDRERLA